MRVAQHRVLALSGGVGGAKLALGLSLALAPEQILIAANTGDDFTHLGLRICPDLDTVMYTLAGISNAAQGWGLEGESWQFMAQLRRLGAQSWFRLGDRDLATHVVRSELLARGLTPSEVTRHLCRQLGIAQPLLPMTDQIVATRVTTDEGDLSFQDYFVRRQCQPRVRACRFDGIEEARVQADVLAWLGRPDLSAIVICPSNPFVSVDPFLAIPGLRAALSASAARVIAVSPIVGGRALKGPAAKMMTELGLPASALAVARYYGDLLDGFVVDRCDRALAGDIEALGVSCLVTQTVMNDTRDRQRLAEETLAFASALAAA